MTTTTESATPRQRGQGQGQGPFPLPLARSLEMRNAGGPPAPRQQLTPSLAGNARQGYINSSPTCTSTTLVRNARGASKALSLTSLCDCKYDDNFMADTLPCPRLHPHETSARRGYSGQTKTPSSITWLTSVSSSNTGMIMAHPFEHPG